MTGLEYLRALSDSQLAAAGLHREDLDFRQTLIHHKEFCPDMIDGIEPQRCVMSRTACDKCVASWLDREMHETRAATNMKEALT